MSLFQVLREYGGIYLDNDCFVVNEVVGLRKHHCVVSKSSEERYLGELPLHSSNTNPVLTTPRFYKMGTHFNVCSVMLHFTAFLAVEKHYFKLKCQAMFICAYMLNKKRSVANWWWWGCWC